MCDPVTLGSAAVATAGSIYSGKEASDNARRTSEARNAATMAEVERGKAYGEKSRGVFDTNLTAYDNQPQQLADAQRTTGAAIAGNAPTDVGMISSGNAPAIVAEREGARMADVFTRNAGLDQKLGNLKGYDASNLTNSLRNKQAGRDIDMIGDFAKTSSGVNAVEQRASAQNAFKPPSGIGEILQTAGKVGSFYGGKGSFKFGTPGAAAAPNFAPMTSAGAIY